MPLASELCQTKFTTTLSNMCSVDYLVPEDRGDLDAAVEDYPQGPDKIGSLQRALPTSARSTVARSSATAMRPTIASSPVPLPGTPTCSRRSLAVVSRGTAVSEPPKVSTVRSRPLQVPRRMTGYCCLAFEPSLLKFGARHPSAGISLPHAGLRDGELLLKADAILKKGFDGGSGVAAVPCHCCVHGSVSANLSRSASIVSSSYIPEKHAPWRVAEREGSSLQRRTMAGASPRQGPDLVAASVRAPGSAVGGFHIVSCGRSHVQPENAKDRAVGRSVSPPSNLAMLLRTRSPPPNHQSRWLAGCDATGQAPAILGKLSPKKVYGPKRAHSRSGKPKRRNEPKLLM